jgi:hypothetical protein
MQETIKKLAESLGLSEQAVRSAYKAYWKFIREKITSLNLKKNISEDDYSKLKTSFNLPSLGKLNCPYDRWLKIRKDDELKIKNTIKDDKYQKD